MFSFSSILFFTFSIPSKTTCVEGKIILHLSFIASNILLRLGVKRDWSKPSAGAGTQFSGIDA